MATKYKFEFKPRSQQYMMDMEFLGSNLLRDTKKLSYVIRRFADDTFLSFFAQFGISTGEQGVPGLESGTIGESIVRWRVLDNSMKASKVIDNSQLPGTIYANKPFVLGIDENWVAPAGIYLLEDMKTTLYVRKRGEGPGPVFNYSFEFISGTTGETLVRKDLLAPGKYLNYIGNARPELSNESQPIKFDSGGYDLFNVTQTVRHKAAASGHALSTMTVMNAYDANGVFDPENSGFLPFDGREMLKFHFRALATTLYYSRTNFDAVNRRVLTLDADQARTEVPITAGAQQQFQWTESQFEYNPLDPTVTLMNQIDGIIASRSDHFRDKDTVYLIITGNGGTQILDAIRKYKHVNEVQIQQQLPADGKIKRVGIDYQMATYWTPNGSFSIMNTAYMSRPRGFMAERVNFKGAAYDKDGFDMYIIPVKKLDDGRRTIRLATKAANGVNRGLVIGSLAGMSGMHNGAALDVSNIGGKEFAATMSAQQDRFKIASPVDGEQFLCLSELCVIVEDPDSITWVKAKFPNMTNN